MPKIDDGNSGVANFFSQFTKFAWVGVVATLLQYLVLVLLVSYAGQRPTFASAMGYAIAACMSYYLNYYFTFASRNAHRDAIIRFVAIAAAGLLLNSLIVLIFNESMGVNYLLAQVVATAVVFGWNFFANRRWTFGSKKIPIE